MSNLLLFIVIGVNNNDLVCCQSYIIVRYQSYFFIIFFLYSKCFNNEVEFDKYSNFACINQSLFAIIVYL